MKRYDSLEDLHKFTISVRGAAAVLLGRKSRSGRSGVGGSQERERERRAKTDGALSASQKGKSERPFRVGRNRAAAVLHSLLSTQKKR